MIKKCQMCGVEKKLCMAHILPEALKTIINPGKIDDHFIAASISKGTDYKKQTLQFDKEILCATCDGNLGKYDKVLVEAVRCFFNDEARNRISQVVDVNIDTEKLKLAFAAVLYRMSLSKRFPKLHLGEVYEPEFKTWLKNGSIPKYTQTWLEVVLIGYNKDQNGLDRTLAQEPTFGRAERVFHYFIFLPGLLAIAKVGKAEWTSTVAKYPRINVNPKKLEIPVLDFNKSINLKLLFQASDSYINLYNQKGET